MSARSTSLEFLQAVYLNEELPLSVRLRAAIEAAPYEHAKLQAIGIGTLNGTAFADKLERALLRSEQARLIEGTCVEDEGR